MTTVGSIVAGLMVSRERAERAGDWNVVRECDFELRRYGIVVQDGEVMDTYVPAPAKRGPGRPRKESVTDAG